MYGTCALKVVFNYGLLSSFSTINRHYWARNHYWASHLIDKIQTGHILQDWVYVLYLWSLVALCPYPSFPLYPSLSTSCLTNSLLLSFPLQNVISEPFEPSPFMPAVNKAFDNDFDVPNSLPQKSQIDSDVSTSVPGSEKENNTRENNVAKIKVVVCLLVYKPLVLHLHVELFWFIFLFDWWLLTSFTSVTSLLCLYCFLIFKLMIFLAGAQKTFKQEGSFS